MDEELPVLLLFYKTSNILRNSSVKYRAVTDLKG